MLLLSKVINEESGKRIRSPIAVILGHVDSGKTSLLDKVRGTAVQAREAAGITQHVGASFFPTETIVKVSSKLIKNSEIELNIPGILIVDTPGHAVFTNLRKRGASVADIAILVVDLMRGFQAQTYESMDILKARKVPFIVAANKVDRISAWKGVEGATFIESYNKQIPKAKKDLDNRIYEIMGELSELKFEADRYDRVKDFRKKIAIIPTSAVTGEGIPDLFLVLAGLTQQFMMKKLEYSTGPGSGTVLEVKDVEGMGTTADIILYDGVITKNDQVVIGGRGGAKLIKIRALLQAKELDEMRDPRDKFRSVDKVYASAGLKISAPGLEDVLSGAPVKVAPKGQEQQVIDEVNAELQQFVFDTEDNGVIVKVDTLGSLEAIVDMLKSRNIPIQKADVGEVTKKDIIDAAIVAEKAPEYGAVLCFNTELLPDAEEEASINDIKIFSDRVIYNLIDEYERWKEDVKESIKAESLKDIIMPGKIQILPGYVFRRSNPAIIGVEVLAGKINTGLMLIREDNRRVGRIHGLQDRGENIQEAKKGQQVAMSIRGPTVGRQINEGDFLYIDIPERHVRLLKKKYSDSLTQDQSKCLDELIEIKRKNVDKWWAW
ncbi:MAG: translation initiation factor IF-2 [Candidatus Heimdallarchaeum endolithica]|uniref:Probable translation initiation factor IF-2 n=1 Tax=Candidatus Heimdallarchaeum endolithica TaxID=2876572 RepID=A0A9Y1BNG0_9ARCH|nr:MAG: translation initiation factor IF-2 [Candidatus Heimdallarchaeum endolithica]